MIRKALPADIDAMVDLSEQKRSEYEGFQPLFWKKAAGSREKQKPFFEAQLQRPNILAWVAESEKGLEGFLIAALVPAPPVYEPGGPTCLIDDFVVPGDRWGTLGRELLEKVRSEALEKGAVQTAVFSGHLDGPKRKFLVDLGFSIATETYVKPLKD